MNVTDDFIPIQLLRNPHLMTIVSRYWPRENWSKLIPESRRFFTTEPGTQLLGYSHWQNNPRASPTVVLVHGLEGSADSHYMHGITAKAYSAGFNVLRMNQRTCGGTDHLTPTLYNSGRSKDFRRILHELTVMEGMNRIWFIGYSMGGNLVLKAAGELGSSYSSLTGIVAVSPNIDPSQCVAALEQPGNWLYHRHFLSGLKARMKRKAKIFPGKWDLDALRSIKSIRQFDEVFTARDGGYTNCADYYDRAGARHVMQDIAVPTLIITAHDDPFIPFSMFDIPAIKRNPNIKLLTPRYGGHCGFLQKGRAGGDHFWAEQKILEVVSAEPSGLD